MLRVLLAQRQDLVLRRWIDAIASDGGSEDAAFLRGARDRFANPAGHTLVEALRALLACVVDEASAPLAEPVIDLVRLRAIQPRPPSRALAFFLHLKRAVREELGVALTDGGHADELHAIEARIDDLVLAAFDAFVASREKIYEVRANEVRRRVAKVLERAEGDQKVEPRP
jgi:RsbT co-antagonist protein rsbRD N-terminal domain